MPTIGAGTILYPDFNAFPGIFTELNPEEFPIISLLMARGVDLLPQKEYTYTYHTNPDYLQRTPRLMTDLGTVSFGSTGFTTGSNVIQSWFEGAFVSWARQNDQSLGRTLNWKGQTNPSYEQNPMVRAMSDALYRIKADLEYVAREGIYFNNTAGTGTWQQRGYRYAPGISNFAADGALAGTAGTGRLGTLTTNVVLNAIQQIWDNKVNGSDRLTIVTNSTGKRELSKCFGSTFRVGENNLERNFAGRNITTIETDFGLVDVLLTHNMPKDQMYILNLDQMRAVGHVAKGGQLFYEEEIKGNGVAGDGRGIYTEIGVDHGVGSCHARIYGVGSTVGTISAGTVQSV